MEGDDKTRPNPQVPSPRARLAGVLIAAFLSCSPSGSTESPGGALNRADASSGLSPTLALRVEGDTVRLMLRVTNAGAEAVRIDFTSAQRFDFLVLDAGGGEVWRWGAGQGFAQMLGSEDVTAGATLAWEAAWLPGDRSGSHEAVARLASVSHPIELRMPFELSGK